MATHSSVLTWRIPMDRGAWWITVHGVAKSWTQLKRLSMHARCNSSVSSVTQLCPTFATPWTSARQASLSITNSQSLLTHAH